MFESQVSVNTDQVRAWAMRLATDLSRGDDTADIDLIRALEELTCAAQAAQAVLSVGAQIGSARRESPNRGQKHLALAHVLCDEMPCALAAFRTGRITEWKATILARETACLSLADRRAVDAQLAGNPEKLASMGDQELAAAASRLAYHLDPEAFVERRRRAESERRVTLRPAPDVMSHLSALLPMKQGIAVYAVLTREADRLRAAGDTRSRAQVMADALVARVLGTGTDGTATADPGQPAVMINLVVSDDVLLGASNEPGQVAGYGPVPADLARELATESRAWLRRVYTSPATGALVAMDSRARCVPDGIAALIRARDQRCRTLWCDAPIRHIDHVEPVDEGGTTTVTNLQGLCEACNHAKQAPGWHARPCPGPRHTVETTTPTGHSYCSTSPPLSEPRYVEVSAGHWVLVA